MFLIDFLRWAIGRVWVHFISISIDIGTCIIAVASSSGNVILEQFGITIPKIDR